MQKLKRLLIKILEEMGFIVFDKNEDDFSLGDYIIDSLQFIEFIICVEKVLCILNNGLDFLELAIYNVLKQ